ncbi:hypothetical protein SGHV013 [Glossina pallidipes salivary gland hypertrophy virus]|uniref:Uncharacterized protein n=1 Tax=Glossina hytrovirus (isolate Glossina pallidipes/Ethiopia/Seibersdorf/-) TaxID=379529 RepID=B0YLG7_GHVS|nr:hypothetical protein SGHV013 [Glossina pallidipes salivary gland hypertrophy virus]ABQ08786.1 hypothetical protein SGHV013 [Glossina pallidipes salivary gland hypertrophy virus]
MSVVVIYNVEYNSNSWDFFYKLYMSCKKNSSNVRRCYVKKKIYNRRYSFFLYIMKLIV